MNEKIRRFKSLFYYGFVLYCGSIMVILSILVNYIGAPSLPLFLMYLGFGLMIGGFWKYDLDNGFQD